MKFCGQFGPQVDAYIFHRFFEGELELKSWGVFIEWGAFDGHIESSCLFFEEALGWRGFNIEASPSFYKKLEQNRPRSTNFNVALSNFDGTIIFTEVHHPGFEFCTNGSVSHLPAHPVLDELQCQYSKTEVQAGTYSSFLKKSWD